MLEETLLFIILTVAVLGFGLIIRTLKSKQEPRDDGQILLLQNQINELNRTLDGKLGESARAIREQFGETAKIVRDVTEKLTKLDETNRQVVSFSDQLKNLQDILKNPKQRGVLGEYYLETVLKNVLPPGSYQMQYPFKNGVIVDAAVFVDKRIIPIDSKFSLENYNRILEAKDAAARASHERSFVQDIKTRIDETSKYVKPEEDTMEFAFMFIPSEAVYYDLLINKVGAVQEETNNLIQYAAKKRVIIVSPTSFLAYLQTVLQGLKNQKISEQASEIVKQVQNLSRHLSSYEDYLRKLGRNLGVTVSAYNSAYKEFGKIDKDFLRITGSGMDAEPLEIERPSQVEETE